MAPERMVVSPLPPEGGDEGTGEVGVFPRIVIFSPNGLLAETEPMGLLIGIPLKGDAVAVEAADLLSGDSL